MQEGTLSLMQLVKTVAATERLRQAGVPLISVMSDPTTGGVFASFAALGDVNLAEPNALIGFAGARVSAGTIQGELPEGFQRSEFLFDHGFVDRVVHRSDLRDELVELVALLAPAELDDGRSRPGSIAAFRPLSFLSALADRVSSPSPTRSSVVERLTARARRKVEPAEPVAAERDRPTRRRPSGRGSSWPATCAGRGRSSCWP